MPDPLIVQAEGTVTDAVAVTVESAFTLAELSTIPVSAVMPIIPPRHSIIVRIIVSSVVRITFFIPSLSHAENA